MVSIPVKTENFRPNSMGCPSPTVELFSRSQTLESLRDDFAAAGDRSFTVELRRAQTRGIEPSVLVASITSLGAFLTAVLGIAQKRKIRRIVISGRRGRIEVPADTPREDVDYFVSKALELDADSIRMD